MNKKKKNEQQDQEEDIGFDLKGYSLIALLGSGSFGKVFRARKKHLECQEFAIKMFNKATINLGEVERIKTEAKILSDLNHPNIVKFHDIVETSRRLYIIMELIRDGSLKSLIKQRTADKGFTDEEASILMKKILEAVVYLHDNNIIHRDLKPENILIDDKTDMSSVKIADFGLSAQLTKSTYSKQLSEKCGTMLYMAPEFANEQEYSKPVDIWSCGIIMYELLNMGRHPISEGKEQRDSFFQKLKNPTWEFSDKFSNLARDFFQKLTCQTASKRYSANQALNHPWITRNLKDNIPLTFEEANILYFKSLNVIKVIKGLMFVKFIKEKVWEEMKKEYESGAVKPRILSGKRDLQSGKRQARPTSKAGIVRKPSNEEKAKAMKDMEKATLLKKDDDPDENFEESPEKKTPSRAEIITKSKSIFQSRDEAKFRSKLSSLRSDEGPSLNNAAKACVSTSPLRKKNFSPPVRRTELLLQSGGNDSLKLIRPMRVGEWNQESNQSPRTKKLLTNKMLSTTQSRLEQGSSPKNFASTQAVSPSESKRDNLHNATNYHSVRANETSIMAEPSEFEEAESRMLASVPLKQGVHTPNNRLNIYVNGEIEENNEQIDARMLASEPLKRSPGRKDTSAKRTKAMNPSQLNANLNFLTKISNCECSIFESIDPDDGESKMLASENLKKNYGSVREVSSSKRGARIELPDARVSRTPLPRKIKADSGAKEEVSLPNILTGAELTKVMKPSNAQRPPDHDPSKRPPIERDGRFLVPISNENQNFRLRARSTTFTDSDRNSTSVKQRDKNIGSENELKEAAVEDANDEERKLSSQGFRIHTLPRNYTIKNEGPPNEKGMQDRGKSPLKLTPEMATSLKLNSAQRARSGNSKSKN